MLEHSDWLGSANEAERFDDSKRRFEMKAVRAIQAILIAIPLVVLAGSANAANVIQDGAFRRSIGIGFNPSTPWNDWTGAGISNSHTAPVSIPGPGNYASIPVGGVLFQRFGTLSNGTHPFLSCSKSIAMVGAIGFCGPTSSWNSSERCFRSRYRGIA